MKIFVIPLFFGGSECSRKLAADSVKDEYRWFSLKITVGTRLIRADVQIHTHRALIIRIKNCFFFL